MTTDAPLAQQHGLLLLNKPSGPSSTGCLERIKKGLGQRKIGHAGTLDPFARGVLLVLLGKGTKLAPYLTEGRKVYWGRLRLGLETDTYDLKGEVIAERGWQHLTPEEVAAEIEAWTSLTEQEVPPYAAAKHQGRTFYSMMRQGDRPPEKTKRVRIDRAEALDLRFPDVAFRVGCSHGTYIRSLAHSLGMRMGCGAILTDLVREESAPFRLEQAVELDAILDEPERFMRSVLNLEHSLPHWPKLRLEPSQVTRVQNGHWLRAAEVAADTVAAPSRRAMALAPDGKPVALMEAGRHGEESSWAILRGLWS